MLPAEWIEHRRADRELVGWIAPEGDGFLAYNILGRLVTLEPVDWLSAEEALDELGIGYLADRCLLTLPDGSERPVRITEVNTQRVVVVADEFGAASAVGSNADRYELEFPVPKELRPDESR